jgi:hypothetical protein
MPYQQRGDVLSGNLPAGRWLLMVLLLAAILGMMWCATRPPNLTVADEPQPLQQTRFAGHGFSHLSTKYCFAASSSSPVSAAL